MAKHTKSSVLHAIRNAPLRGSMSLPEYAEGLKMIRAGIPGMTMEELALYVDRDIRFVRRVIAIADRIKREQR